MNQIDPGFSLTFGLDLGSLVSGRVSDDPDFLEGMIHTVALEYDLNSVGGAAGSHPGHPSNWQPVEGMEAIPCRVVIKRSVPLDSMGRPGAVRVGRVLFGQEIFADQQYSMIFNSAIFGPLRLYLIGPIWDAHEMGHHWVGDFQDCPLTLGVG